MPKKRDEIGKPPASRAVQRRAYLHQRSHVSSLRTFEHQALRTPDHQIRLLRFLRDDKLGLIFELEAYNVQEAPPYAAISYTWGEPGRVQNIIINDDRLEVGQNAHYALWQATVASRSRPMEHYWIDSVCIDQSDLREKSHQVGMMGRIYSGAALVYACVGQHSGTSRSLAQAPNVGSMRDDIMRAMIDLGQRAYWSRLWIIQELILANKFQVLCGDIVVSMKSLGTCLALASYEYEQKDLWVELGTTPMAAVLLKIWPSEDGTTGRVDRTTIRFKDCVMRFHTWKCADRRDRIYAFASFNDAEEVVPDYSISPAKLALDFLNYLNQHGEFDRDTMVEEISLSLVRALQLDVGTCQALRNRLARKGSRPRSSLSQFGQSTSIDADGQSQARKICWVSATFVSLQEATHGEDPALEINPSTLGDDVVKDVDALLNTHVARQEVQAGALKKITVNNQPVGFVNATARPGDYLIDLQGCFAQWPWIVVRPDQDGIFRSICSAWLFGGVTLCRPAIVENSNRASNVAASQGSAKIPVHGSCSVSFNPEDLLVLAASVISSGGSQPPETLAHMAKQWSNDSMNAYVELRTTRQLCSTNSKERIIGADVTVQGE